MNNLGVRLANFYVAIRRGVGGYKMANNLGVHRSPKIGKNNLSPRQYCFLVTCASYIFWLRKSEELFFPPVIVVFSRYFFFNISASLAAFGQL